MIKGTTATLPCGATHDPRVSVRSAPPGTRSHSEGPRSGVEARGQGVGSSGIARTPFSPPAVRTVDSEQVPPRASRAACRGDSAKVAAPSAKRACQGLTLREREVRGVDRGPSCSRWAVPGSGGVFSAPGTVPPWGGARGHSRQKQVQSGRQTAPRLCPSSRGEGSDGKPDARVHARSRHGGRLPDTPRLRGAGQRPGSAPRINLERTVTRWPPPASAQRHSGGPTGRIRAPRPPLPGNCRPERGR